MCIRDREIDANNPNKRNFANQSIELIEARRNGKSVVAKFRHTNNDGNQFPVRITCGTVYDDQGNQLQVDGVSFVKNNERIDINNKNNWKRNINSRGQLDLFTFIDNVSNTVSTIPRLTIEFNGFDLSWENIEIQGSRNQINSTPSPCLLYTSPSPRDRTRSRMPSSA